MGSPIGSWATSANTSLRWSDTARRLFLVTGNLGVVFWPAYWTFIQYSADGHPSTCGFVLQSHTNVGLEWIGRATGRGTRRQRTHRNEAWSGPRSNKQAGGRRLD